MSQAPDFTLLDTAGQPVTLSSFWTKAPTFLLFYPGDDTPVCTAQMCSYRDRWHDFSRRGVQVVGINPADAKRHRAFAERHALPCPLLADPGGACCAAYGAKAWYGTRRLTVLIDRDGRIRWRHATWPFLRPKADRLLEALP